MLTQFRRNLDYLSPAMASEFSLPKTSHHTTVIGRTGSGKTVVAMWILSESNFDEMPYIIIDFKGDELLNSIGAAPISVYADPPTEPGLYILHLKPDQLDELDAFLWKVHQNGRTGLFLDEGFVVAKLKSLDAIYMQGRSKEIPVFTLTQRPSWISRYAFSEASHFAVGHLNDDRDQEKVTHFYRHYDAERPEKFHFQWYNVNDDKHFLLPPVPHPDNIKSTFTARLDEMRKRKNKKRFI